MNFTTKKDTKSAFSDCGFYEIQTSFNNAKPYYNAWYLPTKRHLDAGFEKEPVKKACERHAEKMAALKPVQSTDLRVKGAA